MLNLLKNQIITFLTAIFLLIFNSMHSFSKNVNEVKLIKTVNEQIITNYDIKKEYNYLLSINKNLKKLSLADTLKIAEESLIREIIKLDEIKKFIDTENIKNQKAVDDIILDVMKNLNFTNIDELQLHLASYDVSINDLKNKLLIEVLWNQLIVSKYQNKININKDDLIKKIEEEDLVKNDIVQYDLSEIVFEIKNNNELDDKKKIINESILNDGFDNAAIRFSISNTASLGGYIGEIRENQLSNNIKKSLLFLKVGEFSDPINIGSNYLILRINDKKIIQENIDKELLLNKMINYEKQKQLDTYSQIHFNKLKINTFINEF
jgi:peptidyl-prolyl cis-trans isomerase SurA